MLHYDDTQWQAWGVTAEHHRLFILAWEELFNPQTYDAWQVRTANVPTLTRELADAIDVALTEYGPARSHIRPLLEELEDAIQHDIIVKQHFRHVLEYILPFLKKNIDAREPASSERAEGEGRRTKKQVPAEETYDPLPEMRRVMRVLSQHLSEYRKVLIDDLRTIIHEPRTKEKTRLIALTRLLGTDLVASGYSPEYLIALTDVLTESPEPKFSDRFTTFLKNVEVDPGQSTCLFWVKWPPKLLNIAGDHGDVEFIHLGQTELASFNSVANAQATLQDVFARVTVNALDTDAAIRMAEAKVANAFAAIHLYVPNKEFGLQGTDVVVKWENGQAAFARPSHQGDSGLVDRADSAKKTKELLRVQSRLPSADRESLNATLLYLQLAQSAATDEARIVNLWIAVEALVRGDTGPIIERVCRALAPTLALYQLQRLLRATVIDFRKIWKGRESDFASLFPNQGPGRPRLMDLLTVLLHPDGVDQAIQLLGLVGTNPLFKNRLDALYEEVLKEPKLLARSVTRHKQRLEWQLRRIYRGRNGIVHRGTTDGNIRLLRRHLEKYLVLTIQTIATDLYRSGGTWSVSDAFENRRLLFDLYISKLTSAPDSISLRSVAFPEELLTSPVGTGAWQRKASAPAGAAASGTPAPGPVTAVSKPSPAAPKPTVITSVSAPESKPTGVSVATGTKALKPKTPKPGAP